MDIDNMPSNDCIQMDDEVTDVCDNVTMLEISEAIQDIDNKITELETALKIKR